MNEDDPLITVLTPTYNRASTLPRLASSLERQGDARFEWLVVDDGSTDGTPQLLARLEREGVLPLRTLATPNGGKHRAVNRALPIARGSWTFIVDSDDALPPGVLERLARVIAEIDGDEKVGGIMGLRADFSGRVIGRRLPSGASCMDAAEITFRAGIRGDKAELYRTSLLRRFPFPEFDGEKFITECVVWFRIARAGYGLRLEDEVIYLCDYREDGLSANSLRLRLTNPRGTLLFYAEELELDYPAAALLREAANYCRFALQGPAGARGFAAAMRALEGRPRALAAAAFPVGALAAVLDRIRMGRRR
jgi:glycosyltransferase involved in cell wall biosynthesis